MSGSTLYSRQGEGARRTLVSVQSRLSVSRTVLSHCTLALHFRTALSHCTLVIVLSSLYPRLFVLSSLCTVLSTLYSHLCLSHCTLDSVDSLYPHLCTLSHSALIVHSALARSFCTLVSVLSILCTVLSSLCNRGSLSPALCSRKPACATLAASLTMAHCLVQLNSYTISALSLAHHSPISSPPPASIAAGTRHESRSQACGSREVNVRTQQSANACKVSGRAVTSFKSARVCASMLLRPIGIMNFGTRS